MVDPVRSAAIKRSWKHRRRSLPYTITQEVVDDTVSGVDRANREYYQANPEPDDILVKDAKLDLNPDHGVPVTGVSKGSNLSNPKTLMGQQKVPNLSVIPPASIIAQGIAMRYGAFLAPRVDGTYGYGPYNWRDQPIEAHIYIDAAVRHLMQWYDGDDFETIRTDDDEVIDVVNHLGFAIATIGILIDACENKTMIDDRPKVRKCTASKMLADHKMRSSK